MAWVVFAMAAVILFCFSAHFFGRVLVQNKVVYRTPQYNVMALKIGRAYRVFAWGVVTLVMLGSLVTAFIHAIKDVFN